MNNDLIQNKIETPSIGWLVVQAATAESAFPVVGADVVVTKSLSDNTNVLYRLKTDDTGRTAPMMLPGIEKSAAEHPNDNFSSIIKEHSYAVTVSHPNFITMIFYELPIYEGVTSLQYANLIPKSASDNPDNPIEVNEYSEI